ncbi:MAG: universal stress protein [Candidatus Schekmanbacteria bacterium]|nr:universal stress protein [Candidatus Schekmanbacteria bacterium]
MIKIERILVPIDFSEHSYDALSYAAELAKLFQAEIRLFHAIDDAIFLVGASPYATLAAASHESLLEDSREALTRCQQARVPEGVKSSWDVAFGAPAEEIVRAAQVFDCQLIVISTHGHTGLAHVLLGSVAERVVRKSACPVLVVKRPVSAFMAS